MKKNQLQYKNKLGNENKIREKMNMYGKVLALP